MGQSGVHLFSMTIGPTNNKLSRHWDSLFRFRRCALFAALCTGILFLAPCGFAQGGPPFLTDDPETPGTNHWEINAASLFNLNVSPGESVYEVPHIDLNYGWGSRIQLKYEVGYALLKVPQQHLTTGLSNSLAGVKYRFIDEDKHGFSLSTYPQLEFTNPTSSVRRGIADPGKQFFLPLEAARKFGPIEADAEFGYLFRTHDPDGFVYGTLVGHSFRERVEIFGEFHGTTLRQRAGHEALLDIGGRVRTGARTHLLFMTGHSVHRIPGSSPTWFGYLGIQILL